MPQENVDRAGLVASVREWRAGCLHGVPRQEVDWRAIEGAPDDVGEMHGATALHRYVQDWLDTFEEITSVPTELLDVGDDRVVGVQHVTGRARLEPIFGQIKHNRRIARFQRRGIEACRSEWRLIATTHNILKLWRATSAPAAA